MNEVEVKIISKRVEYREYDVIAYVNGEHYTTQEFSDSNSAFAAHTVLRRIILENPDSLIYLKTNVNTLISDIRALEKENRTLMRYLRAALDDTNSRIAAVGYVSK